MKKTAQDIAQFVQGSLQGQADVVIKGISGIKEAHAGELTFLANSKYDSLLEITKASVVLVPQDISSDHVTTIQVDNPSLAFSKVIELFVENTIIPLKGVHASAEIHESVILGNNVAIGPNAVIEEGAVIGDNSIIHAGSYIGQQTVLGKGCLIYPNVTIREKTIIGDRVILHSGAVIGSDGFGFVQVDGKHVKVPQIGNVVIENDVEIGSNTTIDRARFDKTIIGEGTKIDNLVQIAHNVHLEKACIIVSQVGISGSVIVEEGAILAGQVGVAGHLRIGKGAVITAQSGVTKSIKPGEVFFGTPAKPHDKAKRLLAHYSKLEDYANKIKELEKRIEELEGK